jgi:hypothetical protein
LLPQLLLLYRLAYWLRVRCALLSTVLPALLLHVLLVLLVWGTNSCHHGYCMWVQVAGQRVQP